jgi:hypothetical protein
MVRFGSFTGSSLVFGGADIEGVAEAVPEKVE